MSFVSTIMGTAERVPLPDAIIRAAIHQLCSRTATRLATGNAESDAWLADEMAARAIAEYTDEADRPALRGAGGVLRPRARPYQKIFLVLLQGGGLDIAGGRGRGAAPDRRACRSGRWAVDSRTRLRLGFAVAVDGAAVPAFADIGGFQLERAARIYRGRSRKAWPGQSARHHSGREPVRAGSAVRPYRLHRDVRTHDELARIDGSTCAHG